MKLFKVLLMGLLISAVTACGGGGGGADSDTVPDSGSDLDSKTTFKIEKFGQGSVSDSENNLTCNDPTCTETLTVGDTVNLTASPDAGWQLSGWSGCDSVTNDICTVTIAEDTTVFPTFERAAPPVLENNVQVLSSDTIAKITSILDNAILFSSDAADMAALDVGTILVSTSGEGFARKVTEVIALAGSTITLVTTDVPLEEVIGEGTVVFNEPLTTDDLVSVARVKGIEYIPPKGRAVTTTFTFGVDVEVASGVNVTGNVEINITPDFALDIGWTGVQEFKVASKIDVKPSLAVSVSEGIKLVDKKIALPMPTMNFAPIIVGPVVLTPELSGTLEVSAETKVSASVNGWVKVTSKAGARYLKSSGWKGIGDVDVSGSFDPLDIKGEAVADAMVGPNFAVKIYKLAGPSIFVGPYLKASSAYEIIDDCGEWAISAGARGKTALEGGVLGWKIKNISLNLFDVGWKLAGDKFGACADEEPPSTPTGLAVTDEMPTAIQIEWTPSTDNNLVEKYEVYRGSTKVTETDTVSFIDKDLTAGTQYCYHVIAVDSNKNKSESSSTVCGNTNPETDSEKPTIPANLTAEASSSTAISLSWEASTDNAGTVSYLVFKSGSDEVLGGSAELTKTITGLDSGKEYCFQVASLDEAGNTSTLSNEACATTSATGSYRMRSKCDFSDTYVVDTTMDLNEEVSGSISVVGQATDYDGTPMTYVLTGSYDSSDMSMDARIDWSFEGNDCARVDTFSTSLANDDTGDITMNQTSVCGCTAQIRFTKSDAKVSEPKTKPVIAEFLTETISSR
jgi:hypothetical protein